MAISKKLVYKIIILIAKISFFIIELASFSFLTTIYLVEDLFSLFDKTEYSIKKEETDIIFYESIIKTLKVKKRKRKSKKIKKVVFCCLNDFTSKNIINIKKLAYLIQNDYIKNVGLVILSNREISFENAKNINLKVPDKNVDKITVMLGDSACFYIENCMFDEFGKLLNDYIKKKGYSDIGCLELTLHCLSLCYKNIPEDQFISIFPEYLKAKDTIKSGLDMNLLERNSEKKCFLLFCIDYIQNYYSNIIIKNADYMVAIKNIIEILNVKNKYYDIAIIMEKAFSEEVLISVSYIKAYMYEKNILHSVENTDKIIDRLKNYEIGQHFIRIISLQNVERNEKNKQEIKNYLNYLLESNFGYLTKLCFYYYFSNVLYSHSIFNQNFLEDYTLNCLKAIESENKLNNLFISQLLLLSATYEKIKYKLFNKNKAILEKYLDNHINQLDNNLTIIKYYRSANGINREFYIENLEKIRKSIELSENYPVEKNLGWINLGYTEMMVGQYKTCFSTFKKINFDLLKHYNINAYYSALNNWYIVQYVNLKISLKKLEKLIKKCVDKMPNIEEKIFLESNYALAMILLRKNKFEILEIFKKIDKLEDNYFSFFNNHNKLLYNIMFDESIELDNKIFTVYIKYYSSFFENKIKILKNIKIKSIEEINRIIADDKNIKKYDNSVNHENFTYYKRADLFIGVERWFE